MLWAVLILIVLAGVAAAFVVARALARRGMHLWLAPYVAQRSRRRAPSKGQPVHLLLCIADHFEPGHGNASELTAAGRVERWVQEYPRLFGGFRDADGRPPQHTFFYPLEMYRASELDALSELTHAGYGEVEVHLHHDRDSADNLRGRLLEYKQILTTRHNLLPRRARDGEPVYGFIHGDWALANSRPDGRCCGVDNELSILRATGCYADFTFPSVPSPTQPRRINSIYYSSDSGRPRPHDHGVPAGSGPAGDQSLLLIQGPLLLDWQRRKFGAIPRIENGCIQSNQLPSMHRLDLWLRARIQVPARPDWFFVKLHTHGAAERNLPSFLGESMVGFHRGLAERAAQDRHFQFHYVTAREMYNLVRAAEAGWRGSVNDARDYELLPANQPAGTVAAAIAAY